MMAHLVTVVLMVAMVLCLMGSSSGGLFESGLKLPEWRTRRSRGSGNLTLSVPQFGAVGDGHTDDTQAFVKAWKHACSSRSVSVLTIPARKTYLIRPVSLSGPCKSRLTLLILGTIMAPSDPHVWDGLDPRKWLYFHGIKDLVVTGGGTINGMGQEWWESSCKRKPSNPCRHAPTAVTFHRIRRLIVQDLTLLNGQQMHMAFTTCYRAIASHLRVIAPEWSPNTDGIHISSSNSIMIEESLIKTGDDCISIVGDTSNVYVRNIFCGPGHGISIGSLGKSNSSAHVQNVRVDGAFISNTENGVRIKTWQGGHGYARNVLFTNIMMNNVSNPILIDQYYCDSNLPCQNQTTAVHVHNIAYVGIKGTSATGDAIKFACSDTFPCKDLYLADIQLSLGSGEDSTAYCWQAFGSHSGPLYPQSCLSCPQSLIEQTVTSNTTLRSMMR